MIILSIHFLRKGLIHNVLMDTEQVNISTLTADRHRTLLDTNNDNKCSAKVTKI